MHRDIMDTYRRELVEHIGRVDEAKFGELIGFLLDAYRRDAQVFILGNGGSAATANHFVCDFGKNAVQGDKRRFRILSVCDNVEKITALGNDIAYDEIFSQQLKNLMRAGDLLIAISASGNSPNVLGAVRYAHETGARVAALAGFSGGKLKDMSDVCLVAEMDSYERVEDIHLMILHMVVCFFKAHQELLGEA